MSIESLADQAVAFSLPLAMHFRATDQRQGLVFSGPTGWGEFAPFHEYDDAIAGRWLAGALEMAFGNLPKTVRSEVPVNAIIPATDEVTAYELVQKAVKVHGIDTIKVKVAQAGQTLADDVARVRAVRSALVANGISAGKIRLDVNGAWTVDQAIGNLKALKEAANGIDYLEQPCATLPELADLRKVIDVPIAVDESVRLAEDLDVLAIKDAADILIVKAIPLGGVAISLRIIDRLELPVVVSGSMDSSVGLNSALHLAGSVPELYGACGLGTGALLALDLVHTTKLPENGVMSVSATEPDLDCLALAHALTDESVRSYWRSRMISAWYATAQNLVSPEVRLAVQTC